MKSRREQRAAIIEILYTIDLLDHWELPESLETDFIRDMVSGILKNRDKIDALIVAQLERWSLKRLSYVDRAILRLATYELYDTETPHEIIINEALVQTRAFTDQGDNKAVSFNNSVLDKIRKSLNK